MIFLIKNCCHLPVSCFLHVGIRQGNSNCYIKTLQWVAVPVAKIILFHGRNHGITEARKLLSYPFFQNIFSSDIVVCSSPCSCFSPQDERQQLQVQFLSQWREKTLYHIYCLFHKTFPWKMFWSCFHAA